AVVAPLGLEALEGRGLEPGVEAAERRRPEGEEVAVVAPPGFEALGGRRLAHAAAEVGEDLRGRDDRDRPALGWAGARAGEFEAFLLEGHPTRSWHTTAHPGVHSSRPRRQELHGRDGWHENDGASAPCEPRRARPRGALPAFIDNTRPK